MNESSLTREVREVMRHGEAAGIVRCAHLMLQGVYW